MRLPAFMPFFVEDMERLPGPFMTSSFSMSTAFFESSVSSVLSMVLEPMSVMVSPYSSLSMHLPSLDKDAFMRYSVTPSASTLIFLPARESSSR